MAETYRVSFQILVGATTHDGGKSIPASDYRSGPSSIDIELQADSPEDARRRVATALYGLLALTKAGSGASGGTWPAGV